MKKIKIILVLAIFIITFLLVNRLVQPKYSTDLEEGSMTSAYYKEDTYDAGLHLNLTGATKLSKYLAQVLKNESDRIKDYRQNEEINQIYSKKLEKYKEIIK